MRRQKDSFCDSQRVGVLLGWQAFSYLFEKVAGEEKSPRLVLGKERNPNISQNITGINPPWNGTTN